MHQSVGATEEQARNYLKQIVEAELAMKEVGVFDLDIKKENMLINDKGVLKLIDLGLIAFNDQEQAEHFLDAGWSMSYE